MTFDDLRLLAAIHRMEPGASDLVTDARRLNFALGVQAEFCVMYDTCYFPYTVDAVITLYYQYRKNKQTQVKGAIAIAHGTKCFWLERGKGPCCEEAEAGHLVARMNGGELTVENGIIECRSHNNQRRELTIEEYLLSDKRTSVNHTGE